MNVNTSRSISIVFKNKDKDFTEETLESLKVAVELHCKVAVITPARNAVIVAIPVAQVDDMCKLCKDVEGAALIVLEHGPDADLLGELLERHGIDKSHPDAPNIISAFTNLTSLIDATDNTITHSDAKKAELKARAAFRKKSIEHSPFEMPTPDVSEPVIPEVYDKVAKEEHPDGNVFTP